MATIMILPAWLMAPHQPVPFSLTVAFTSTSLIPLNKFVGVQISGVVDQISFKHDQQ